MRGTMGSGASSAAFGSGARSLLPSRALLRSSRIARASSDCTKHCTHQPPTPDLVRQLYNHRSWTIII